MSETKQLNARVPAKFKDRWKAVAAYLGIPQDKLVSEAIYLFLGGQSREIETAQREARKFHERNFGAVENPLPPAPSEKKRKMVRGAGIEPVTPTVSKWLKEFSKSSYA